MANEHDHAPELPEHFQPYAFVHLANVKSPTWVALCLLIFKSVVKGVCIWVPSIAQAFLQRFNLITSLYDITPTPFVHIRFEGRVSVGMVALWRVAEAGVHQPFPGVSSPQHVANGRQIKKKLATKSLPGWLSQHRGGQCASSQACVSSRKC